MNSNTLPFSARRVGVNRRKADPDRDIRTKYDIPLLFCGVIFLCSLLSLAILLVYAVVHLH